ncbi:SurA N-terminal domain-containing protein [Thermodesulfobacteriota bacterium]
MHPRNIAAGAVIFFTIVAALRIGVVHGEISNRVVAIVNDDVITLYELRKKIKEMTGYEPVQLKSQDPNRYLAIRRKILEFIINDKISHEKIEELGIQVTPEQIDATIERIKKDNQMTQEDFLYQIKERGLTYEQYHENLKNELERAKLIDIEVKSKIIVRDEQIAEYYEKHKTEFSSEEKVHLATIMLLRKQKDDAQEMRQLRERGEHILTRLRKGEDFAKLVAEYSEGPGVKEGGDLGQFKITELEPELRKTLEDMPQGGLSGLIVRRNGIQIIKLVERRGGKKKGLEEVRGAIYRILFREEVNKRYSEWIKELRERSYTKIIF